MADHRPPRTSLLLSPEALFRYQIVSAVKARALLGQRMDAAVRAVAAQTHQTPAGESTTVSVRSIYRWLAEQDRDDPVGPEPAPPAPVLSLSLPAAQLDFLAAEKSEDRNASVPELVRRALQLVQRVRRRPAALARGCTVRSRPTTRSHGSRRCLDPRAGANANAAGGAQPQ